MHGVEKLAAKLSDLKTRIGIECEYCKLDGTIKVQMDKHLIDLTELCNKANKTTMTPAARTVKLRSLN